jgi:hypothetical protein
MEDSTDEPAIRSAISHDSGGSIRPSIQCRWSASHAQETHLVKNAFGDLKRQWSVATRYAKNRASFVAAVQIRCIALWIGLGELHPG